MQVQKPYSRFSRRATSPLKGADSFSVLMRTKPLAVWGACLVHALVKQENPLSSNTNINNSNIELGLIVPKKVYALAVDRNRIRRVLRAHCLELAQGLPCTVQILFGITA
jgi:ribonuclease P protein component